MNFFSIILFWPTESYNVYGHDALQVGIRNLALGFPILAGACIVLLLLSWTRGKIRELMFVSCVFMTLGMFHNDVHGVVLITTGTGLMVLMKRDNIWLSYILLIISGLGVGGIVVPASIITAIICPDELIATVTALTIAIRVLGGAIGYAIYYNVFLEHFKTNSQKQLVPVLTAAGIKDQKAIVGIINLTGAGLIDVIRKLPGMTDQLWVVIVEKGQQAYADSYPYVYYVSIAFGCAATIASLFLTNIDHYMTDHVAVKLDETSEFASGNEKAAA
jgi:hypothetical protein